MSDFAKAQGENTFLRMRNAALEAENAELRTRIELLRQTLKAQKQEKPDPFKTVDYAAKG